MTANEMDLTSTFFYHLLKSLLLFIKFNKRMKPFTNIQPPEQVCTLNSVIKTIKRQSMDKKKAKTPEKSQKIFPPPQGVSPQKLQRNKTIRWSGTRKAPKLIREFTTKQRAESDPKNREVKFCC